MHFDCTVILRTTARRAGFLARALASVRAQTSLPELIVVVGDGMKEAELAAAILAAGGGGATSIKPVAIDQRVGRASAANAGLRRVCTEWFAFLDDDDTWDPSFLAMMSDRSGVWRDEADFGAVVCRTEAVYESQGPAGIEELEREPFNPGLRCVNERVLMDENLFTIHAALWHRRVLERLGCFREDLEVMEDWEFNVRAARVFRIEVLPRMLAHYHLRPSADATANSAATDHDRTARLLRAEWVRQGRLIPGRCGRIAAAYAELRRRWRRARERARWRRRLA